MIFAYCRISQGTQNIERQIRNILKDYPGAKVIKEVFSGTRSARPEWQKLLHTVKTGDTIVFDSVSRMHRNAAEGFAAYEELYRNGVDLVFLKEPHINTSAYRERLRARIDQIDAGGGAAQELINAIIAALNDYTMEIARDQIYLAFGQAQKEVDDLRQRTREGMETARRAGKKVGGYTAKAHRTERPIKEIIRAKSRDFGGTNTDAEVMAIIRGTAYTDSITGLQRTYTIARGTYYKYKASLAAEVAEDCLTHNIK